MNKVYFGEKGLTSSEANFIANLGKETILSCVERLSKAKFYDTSISLITSNESKMIQYGNSDVDWIEQDLIKISEVNALTAWLREAIKEKEKETERLENMNLEDWTTVPENNLIYPKAPKPLKGRDIVDTWPIDKLNRYLMVEAIAATYGKYIHPDGAISTARKKLLQTITTPIKTEGEGQNTVIYTFNPTVQPNVIENLFTFLQSQHRDYEKELNYLKAEATNEANKQNVENTNNYQNQIRAYRQESDRINSIVNELEADFEKWQIAEIESVAKLKIVIPDTLSGIYNYLKSLSPE